MVCHSLQCHHCLLNVQKPLSSIPDILLNLQQVLNRFFKVLAVYFMMNTMSSAYPHSLSIKIGFPMFSPSIVSSLSSYIYGPEVVIHNTNYVLAQERETEQREEGSEQSLVQVAISPLLGNDSLRPGEDLLSL